MTRPDIKAIETHHAWTEGIVALSYEMIAACPFLLRDPLIDAQKDRAALLAYVARLEAEAVGYQAALNHWLRANFFERKPEVSEPSGDETKRDVDSETGNGICPWFKQPCICAQCQTDALACPMGIYGRVIGRHARTMPESEQPAPPESEQP